MKDKRIIYIRPKFKESAQGRNKNKSTAVGGRVFGKVKAEGAKFIWQIPDNATRQCLHIPLWEEVDNPWYVSDKSESKLPSEWINSDVWSKPKITKQTYYELKHNKKAGTYNYSWFIPERGKKNQERNYLQKMQLILSDEKHVLDLSIPDNELWYEAIMFSKLFASSYEEAMNSEDARFYISYEYMDEDHRLEIERLESSAIVKLDAIQTKYPGILSKVSTVLGLSKGTISEDGAWLKLKDFITTSTSFNTPYVRLNSKRAKIEEFIKLCSLITSKSKNEKDRFRSMWLLQTLINGNVISNVVNVFKWRNKVGTELEVLATSRAAMIEFLSNPANEDVIKQLKDEANVVE